MRKVEPKYENISLEHTHGNSRPKSPCRRNTGTNNAMTSGKRPGDPSQPSVAGGTDAGDSDPDDEDSPPPRTSDADTEDLADCDEGSLDIIENTADHDHSNNSADDGESIDSDADFDEVGSDDGYESFGLADP